VVLEKRPLNGCNSTKVFFPFLFHIFTSVRESLSETVSHKSHNHCDEHAEAKLQGYAPLSLVSIMMANAVVCVTGP